MLLFTNGSNDILVNNKFMLMFFSVVPEKTKNTLPNTFAVSNMSGYDTSFDPLTIEKSSAPPGPPSNETSGEG